MRYFNSPAKPSSIAASKGLQISAPAFANARIALASAACVSAARPCLGRHATSVAIANSLAIDENFYVDWLYTANRLPLH